MDGDLPILDSFEKRDWMNLDVFDDVKVDEELEKVANDPDVLDDYEHEDGDPLHEDEDDSLPRRKTMLASPTMNRNKADPDCDVFEGRLRQVAAAAKRTKHHDRARKDVDCHSGAARTFDTHEPATSLSPDALSAHLCTF